MWNRLRLPRVQSSNPEISKTATKHGHDLLRQGFTASQVVHGYGDVCQAITELALEENAPISTDDFRMLNRCLDDAIAAAVTEYGRKREESNGGTATSEALLEITALNLQNSLYCATSAFDALKAGQIGVAGSTGKVLDRSLSVAQDLIGRVLAELGGARRRAEQATGKTVRMP
jgi:hypothetical protein